MLAKNLKNILEKRKCLLARYKDIN